MPRPIDKESKRQKLKNPNNHNHNKLSIFRIMTIPETIKDLDQRGEALRRFL